ncbi:MAG TPA: MFS transporter [Candidatus Limnocylindria bacterium]|jgi:MFS family permease|nr:MFS transporter [Candidatus Limnocylindria bacterium]
MRLPLILEPLRHRDFRLLWTGQTVSSFGNFLYMVAVPFQILALGGSPLQLGLGAAISTGTMLVFLLLGGAIVDRLPRRRIILASDVASGCVVLVVALLGFVGALRIEHLYVASAFFGMTSAFFMPAMTAIIPELVPAGILQSGNAVRGLSAQTARIGGPVIGGLIVAVAGPPLAFAIDAATFFVSFAALWLARPPRREPPPPAPFLEQVRAGISFTFSVPWLWITICIFAVVNLGIAGPLIVALPLLVRDVLHADARVYGAIGTAVGIGELCGTFLGGQFPVRRTGIVMYVWAILTGVAVAAIGFVAALPEIFVFAFAQGLSLVGFGVLWDTAVQRHVPKDMLGRVSSVDAFGSILLLPISPLIFATLVERVGPQGAFIVGGVISAGLCLAALGVRSIRDLE